ncbi:MAG: diguanylate cyclase, partial [Rhodospirillales bacterium]|nr:diguanylate cyclase [Rhodospirillales bacterium]
MARLSSWCKRQMLTWAAILTFCFATSMAAQASADPIIIDNLSEPHSFAGLWKFKTGDDPVWASPGYEDSNWNKIKAPLTWVVQGYEDYKGIGWYRIHFVIGPNVDRRNGLAVHLGKIHSAYEVYANGHRLGGVGRLPPSPSANYDKMMTYQIPSELIGNDGRLVLALRVWGGGNGDRSWDGGAYFGDFLIGSHQDITTHEHYRDIVPLVLTFLYIFIGLYHLYLFQRHPELRNYLWFALLCLDIGVYTFVVSQWAQDVGWTYLIQKKIEYSVVYVQPALWIQMISSFVGFRIPRWLRAYQLSFLLMVIPVLAIHDLDVNVATLKYWQIWTLLLIIMMPLYVTWMAWKGNQEARMLWFGLAIFGLCSMNDILIDLVYISTPHLVPFGFFAIILFMMLSLANSFTRMYAGLEDEVDLRTQELRLANEKLGRISITDPLTDMLNRRGFNEAASVEVSRAERFNQPFALIIADIDHFKSFNDQYGHACGDAVLQQVSSTLKAHLRDVDYVARWGGEEFIFLLPGTGIEGGMALA